MCVHASENRLHPKKAWNMNFQFFRKINIIEKTKSFQLWIWVTFATFFISAFLIISSELQEASTGSTELIANLDIFAARFMGNIRNSSLNGPVIDITAFGSSTVITIFILVASVLLARKKRYLQLVQIIFAAAGSVAISSVMKSYFERPRPINLTHLVDVQGYSYPSGHSLSSSSVYFTFAILLYQEFRKPIERALVAVFAILFVFLIALSRVYLGVHYLSDAVAGVFLGMSWAAILGAFGSFCRTNRNS